MKIAIHDRRGSFSDKWIEYCQDREISYKLVDCYKSDIINQLEDCSGLMWHFHHASPRDFLFAKQLLFAIEQSGKKTFPDFNTGWHFDDKVGQKYLFDSLNIDAVPTWVYYEKSDALSFARRADYPLVFKLRGGAGSVNVHKVESFSHAKRLISTAFGKGFKHSSLSPVSDLMRRYKSGIINNFDLIKGFIRRIVPTEYSKVHGREKGYILFQKFIEGNDCDFRIIVIDKKAFALKRLVRPNDFRASGSGLFLFDRELFSKELLKCAFEIASKIKGQTLAMDFIHKGQSPLLVEISYGFPPVKAIEECQGYWDSGLNWHEGKFNPYGWMVDLMLKQ